jgi:flagellin-like protein
MKNNKKSQSEVITTVLLILLVLASIVIVYKLVTGKSIISSEPNWNITITECYNITYRFYDEICRDGCIIYNNLLFNKTIYDYGVVIDCWDICNKNYIAEFCNTREVYRIDSCESEKCIDGYTREEKECDDGWKDTYCRVNKSRITKKWLDSNCLLWAYTQYNVNGSSEEIFLNKNKFDRHKANLGEDDVQTFRYKCFDKYTVEVNN